jgi:hypothetical protein
MRYSSTNIHGLLLFELQRRHRTKVCFEIPQPIADAAIEDRRVRTTLRLFQRGVETAPIRARSSLVLAVNSRS